MGFKNLVNNFRSMWSEKSFSNYLSSSATLQQSQSSITASELLLRPYTDAGRFGWVNVRANMAWQYYKEISPINNAIDLASDVFVTVPFAIMDTTNGELITEPQQSIPATGILELLENPNQDYTGCDFKEQQNKTYEVTGDTFMLTTSTEVDSEPLEIFWINSKNVSSTSNDDDIAVSYTITSGQFRGTYYRKELDDDRIVYLKKEGELGPYSQLWIMKTFNPDTGASSGGRGLSRLSSIFMEIESHNGISLNNNSILRNGMRPSIAVVPRTDKDGEVMAFTDDQIRQMKEQAIGFYGGPNNAGNVMVLNAIEKVIELSKNNKDMEFMQLLEIVKAQIYRNLRIPLPLISDKAMTFANFKEALGQLIKLNTLPFARKYADQINRFLMPRYDNSGRYRYVVNEDAIPALEVEKLLKMKEFKGAYTLGEIREFLGKAPLEDDRDNELFQERRIANIANPNEGGNTNE